MGNMFTPVASIFIEAGVSVPDNILVVATTVRQIDHRQGSAVISTTVEDNFDPFSFLEQGLGIASGG